MVVLLRVERTVIKLSSFGEFDEAELELAKRHVANSPISESLHEEFRANLESSPVVATIWELVRKRVTPAMKELFSPLATLNANEADWAQAFAELEREGLFGMVEHDGEVLRALAAIGLVNTFSTEVSLVRMIGKVLDVDDAALEQAMNLSARHGLRLVVKKGESILSLV